MIYFHGFGHFHPENEIDNEFLESLDIGTTDQWITDRVGIKTRRTVLPLDYIRTTKNADLRAGQEARLYSNAETGRRAALMAIERAGLKPSDIGMVIGGGSSPDFCVPSEAATVAHALNIEVPAIDINAACSTFGAHVHFANQMGDSLPDYVLAFTPENITRVTDFSDRSSAVLFGDATSAVVMSTKHRSRMRVPFSTFGSAPAGAYQVVIERLGHFRQQGAIVQKFAIKMMTSLVRNIIARIPPGGPGRVLFVGHQANLTMLESVVKRVELPVEHHFHNIVDYGNQAAAGAPTVISQKMNDFRTGDIVACVVVGSGLSWSSLQLEFV